MIQLGYFLWVMVGLFAVVGYIRGSVRELLSMSGIVLALFLLEQTGDVIISPVIGSASLEQQFYVYAGVLIIIAYFAYQTPDYMDFGGGARGDAREGLQEGLLGATIGGANAYLLFGALWYYMDNLHYPLSPAIMAPAPGTASAELINSLPMVWLLEGNLLTLVVVVMFLFVLIVLV
ncbi:MAG: hypothetical protein JXN59_15745 [Anaerolineae bacterium]|nr:hypothetical protein [Anaerolineae bacterium]